MARFRLIPREEQFFTDFIALTEHIRRGAHTLNQMLSTTPFTMDLVQTIKDIEHECDKHTHAIIDRLNRTFVTPFDREDIHSMALHLDDVMDAIDAAAAVTKLYKVTEPRAGVQRLAQIISESMDLLAEAAAGLSRGGNGILEIGARVSQLEKEADRVHQDAIVALFDDQKHDPIAVIKWKEIFDFLEAATDRCDDVANLLQGVVVKHG
jgi:predicted phosphate transport protein (TIGR00153 family)